MTASVKLLSIAVLMLLGGCATAYYGTMEKFGFEKRDILVDRVKVARAEQAKAQVVFGSALDEFRSMIAVDGGKLERQYDKMSASHERARKQAADVRARVAAVDEVGKKLFREWEVELKQYESAQLRARSERQLVETRRRFDDLMFAMNRATAKMDPVLALYNDQVLFLKHNLNARAVSSLEIEKAEIESRVETLILEMNEAIAEADQFIAAIG